MRKELLQDGHHHLIERTLYIGKKCSLGVKQQHLILYCGLRKYFICLLKGEATAGKSSLINLLLQADILPTSDIKCTQTICEIRKSKDGQKRACCFEVNGGKVIDIDISTEEGKDKLATYITYEDEYSDNPFEKIEIYWPTDAIEVTITLLFFRN